MTTTIVAIATPPGSGAIALLRLSGPQALEVTRKVFRGPALRPRLQTLGQILKSGDLKTVLDQVLATWFPEPKSYTGEEMVEISCHGGPLVTRAIYQSLLQSGACPAGRGEFTQRAFLNGKLDLTQAEAVMDLISAETELARQSAAEQLQGKLGTRIESLRQSLVTILAQIEAYIDFPEEDIAPETGSDLASRLNEVLSAVHHLANYADTGRILREGVRTVICGPPNAGKSSLLNQLTGFDRAIVTEWAGTTRDTIEESINLGGILLRLIDTAGLRKSDDHVERQGIHRSTEAIARAELILEVLDGSEPPPPGHQIAIPKHALLLRVLNKADLPRHAQWSGKEDFVAVSCQSGAGLEALRERITQTLLERQHGSELGFAINARHQVALETAAGFLTQARHGLETYLEPEFLAIEVRSALNALGEIIGQTDIEEILGEIFKTFCIGK